MWLRFLSEWNKNCSSTIFFKSEDIQLFTDAAPSVGCGGIHPIIVVALIWGYEWTRKKIMVYLDNNTVDWHYQQGRPACLDTMQFVRKLTLIYAKRFYHCGRSRTRPPKLCCRRSLPFPTPEIQATNARCRHAAHASTTVFGHGVLCPRLAHLAFICNARQRCTTNFDMSLHCVEMLQGIPLHPRHLFPIFIIIIFHCLRI